MAAVVLLLAIPAAAVGDSPAGPRLTFLRWTVEPPGRDLVTAAPDGSSQEALVTATEGDRPVPRLFFAPSWSPDGRTLAFTGVVDEHLRRQRVVYRTKIFLVSADGSGLRPVAGTAEGFQPVFSPDGQTLAFTRKLRRWRPNGHGGEKAVYVSNTAWLVNLGSGELRQLTPWRNRVGNIPTSFSPDGKTLALTRRPGLGQRMQAVTMSLEGFGSTVLANAASDPVYSPDGTEIAYLHGYRRVFRTSNGPITLVVSDVFVAGSDGSNDRRITHLTQAGAATPNWDPSGQRLTFIEAGFEGREGIQGIGDSVMEVNRDGTCLTEVLTDPNVSYSGTTWQPGPGREAGPITC